MDQELGMKWYKFVIYVQLFLSALLNAASGFMQFTGRVYESEGVSAQLVYMRFNGLQIIDQAFGVALIILAIAAIVVRMKLAGFKSDAPKYYLWFLGLSIAVPVIYLIAAGGVTKISMLDSRTGVQIAANIALIIANYVYFQKREHLFVN